jgi:hypothetical protein
MCCTSSRSLWRIIRWLSYRWKHVSSSLIIKATCQKVRKPYAWKDIHVKIFWRLSDSRRPRCSWVLMNDIHNFKQLSVFHCIINLRKALFFETFFGLFLSRFGENRLQSSLGYDQNVAALKSSVVSRYCRDETCNIIIMLVLSWYCRDETCNIIIMLVVSRYCRAETCNIIIMLVVSRYYRDETCNIIIMLVVSRYCRAETCNIIIMLVSSAIFASFS